MAQRGTWAPQFTTSGLELEDSFFTIGGLPGFANSTIADPNWGGSGFNQPFPPPGTDITGAGWFNGIASNLQGKATFVSFVNADGTSYAGPAVHIGRLVMNEPGPAGTLLTLTAWQTNVSVRPPFAHRGLVRPRPSASLGHDRS